MGSLPGSSCSGSPPECLQWATHADPNPEPENAYEDEGMPSGEFNLCMSQCFPEEDSGDGKPDPGSVVIIVPVVIGAVFLAAGAYAVARKHKTAVAQRRLSHSAASMPSVVAE